MSVGACMSAVPDRHRRALLRPGNHDARDVGGARRAQHAGRREERGAAGHDVVKQYHVCAFDALVAQWVDGKGVLRYMGAIDDQPNTDTSTIAKDRNYVREAFAAVKAGKPVEATATDPYGCSVKYP